MGDCPGLEWPSGGQLPVTADAQRSPDLEPAELVTPGGCSSVLCVTRNFAHQTSQV